MKYLLDVTGGMIIREGTFIWQKIVFPGFKALGPSTALSALNPRSALNPGTILLSYMEIVSKLNSNILFKKSPYNS